MPKLRILNLLTPGNLKAGVTTTKLWALQYIVTLLNYEFIVLANGLVWLYIVLKCQKSTDEQLMS